MKLVLLYGPPGVGKLTVGQLLSEKTGFSLMHNHLILNMLSEVFGFSSPVRKKLSREFRLRMIEEAAAHNVDLITTFGGVGQEYFNLYRQMIALVEKHGGEVILIRLTASEQVILHRIKEASRKEHKKIMNEIDWKNNYAKHPGLFDIFPDREHMSIDTSEMSAEEVARRIAASFHSSQ